MMSAMLVDTSRCIACRGCQAACKNWNNLMAEPTRFTGSYENPPDYTPNTWTRVTMREHERADGSIAWKFGKIQCMHCVDAACVMVCPTGAMHHTEQGTVLIDERKCIACNYCAAACPFHVPRFDQVLGFMRKCTFCFDRLTNGMQPMCVKTCPTGAMVYGDRLELVAEAESRVEALRARGFSGAQVYGPDIVGGTGAIYVLTDAPSLYGLPNDPAVPSSAQIWGTVFRPVRALAVAGLFLGLLVNRNRSRDLQAEDDDS